MAACLAWDAVSTARCAVKQAALHTALLAGCALEQALQAARAFPAYCALD